VTGFIHLRDRAPAKRATPTTFKSEKGTNPEAPIAAAHSGCFTMALALPLERARVTPTELATECAITLESEGQGFRINRSALTPHAKVPNLDAEAFGRVAGGAAKAAGSYLPSPPCRLPCARVR
jgi:lipoyl-dependent peroxiredoxin